jgi:hypothetical protein
MSKLLPFLLLPFYQLATGLEVPHLIFKEVKVKAVKIIKISRTSFSELKMPTSWKVMA